MDNTVFALGAGFTKAFLPQSPLLVDDFGEADLAERIRGLAHASRALNDERNRQDFGIDIERLLTRLDSLMPYDEGQGAAEELTLLRTELKRCFLRRLQEAREDSHLHRAELESFARCCLSHQATCITFNYDDVLDEALYRTTTPDGPAGHGWNPDTGYGFYCRRFPTVLGTTYWDPPQPTSLLLKLHGSVNWMPRRGHREPHVLDAIVHCEDWLDIGVSADSADRLRRSREHL